MPELQFVVGGTPQELKYGAGKTVRSHVARVSWNTYHLNHKPKSKGKKQRQRKIVAITPDQPTSAARSAATSSPSSNGESSPPSTGESSQSPSSASSSSSPPPADEESLPRHGPASSSASTSLTKEHPTHSALSSKGVVAITTSPVRLGAGRGDPFHTYPVSWGKILDILVDHYITNMAVDIIELDGPKRAGLLRTSWFPLVMTDRALFLTVLLMAASSYAAATRFRGAVPYILALKGEALSELNSSLTAPSDERSLSDAAIGAVAKMASYEAEAGNLNAYHMHMSGLQRMVALRGGIFSLGLDGLLRRCIMWIDLGCSQRLGTGRYFAGESFSWALVDSDDESPGQFIPIEPPKSRKLITSTPTVRAVS